MSARPWLWTLGALTFSWSPRASAQVDLEPLRRQLRDDGLGLRVNASLAAWVGNTDGVAVGASTLAGGRSGRHFGYLNASGDYAEYDATATVGKYFAHLRHNFALTSWLWTETFAQVEADRFRRIRLLELIGVGARFGVFQSDEFAVFLGCAYMPEWTQFDDGSGALAHRASVYAALSWMPDDRVAASHTTYYQPRLDAPSDYKVLSVSSMGFKITRLLESKVSVTLRHESRAFVDVEPTDLEVKNSIGVILP